MNIGFFAGMLPDRPRRAVALVAELLMALMALFMAVYGTRLVEATWHNTIGDFPFLSVGVTYLPIPVGGAILLLFVIERILIGPPPEPAEAHDPAHPLPVD
jgi:TRAP-type C4-dicarboxylate transport system permease small subunit